MLVRYGASAADERAREALQAAQPGRSTLGLRTDGREFARSGRILETQHELLAECVAQLLESVDVGPVLPALETTDRGDARAHAFSQLLLGEAVADSTRDDHSGEGFVGRQTIVLRTILRTPASPTPSGGTAGAPNRADPFLFGSHLS